MQEVGSNDPDGMAAFWENHIVVCQTVRTEAMGFALTVKGVVAGAVSSRRRPMPHRDKSRRLLFVLAGDPGCRRIGDVLSPGFCVHAKPGLLFPECLYGSDGHAGPNVRIGTAGLPLCSCGRCATKLTPP